MGDVTIPKANLEYTDHATVLAVQQALASRGFTPKKGIDGVYGPDTANALRSWQYESGSDAVDGKITYGVLIQLGIPAPGTSPVSSALADATRASHARVVSDAEVLAAKQAVDLAKAKVAVAPTPAAKVAAEQQLAVAEKKLEAVDPSAPWWQYALGAAGIGAIGLGLWSMLGKQRK